MKAIFINGSHSDRTHACSVACSLYLNGVGLSLSQNHILDKKETQAVLYTTCVNTATNITLLL